MIGAKHHFDKLDGLPSTPKKHGYASLPYPLQHCLVMTRVVATKSIYTAKADKLIFCVLVASGKLQVAEDFCQSNLPLATCNLPPDEM
jgi:hypothetical protein